MDHPSLHRDRLGFDLLDPPAAPADPRRHRHRPDAGRPTPLRSGRGRARRARLRHATRRGARLAARLDRHADDLLLRARDARLAASDRRALRGPRADPRRRRRRRPAREIRDDLFPARRRAGRPRSAARPHLRARRADRGRGRARRRRAQSRLERGQRLLHPPPHRRQRRLGGPAVQPRGPRRVRRRPVRHFRPGPLRRLDRGVRPRPRRLAFRVARAPLRADLRHRLRPGPAIGRERQLGRSRASGRRSRRDRRPARPRTPHGALLRHRARHHRRAARSPRSSPTPGGRAPRTSSCSAMSARPRSACARPRRRAPKTSTPSSATAAPSSPTSSTRSATTASRSAPSRPKVSRRITTPRNTP